jgi:8-oxo-dGTP diphosphatase
MAPIGFELLPPKFTLTELQQLYESILETELDKRNFRKKILSMNLLEDLNEMQAGVAHRPAKLYQFDQERYKQFVERGYSFDL